MITKSKEAMKRLSILVVLALPAMLEAMADNKLWTLRECEDYAIAHNITVKQSEVAREKQAYALSTARNSRLPNLSGTLNEGLSFGRGLKAETFTRKRTPVTPRSSYRRL